MPRTTMPSTGVAAALILVDKRLPPLKAVVYLFPPPASVPPQTALTFASVDCRVRNVQTAAMQALHANIVSTAI